MFSSCGPRGKSKVIHLQRQGLDISGGAFRLSIYFEGNELIVIQLDIVFAGLHLFLQDLN